VPDFGSQEVEAFRQSARAWLEENFPQELRGNTRAQIVDVHGPANTHPAFLLWKERMGAKGWGVPTWPKEYGGGGLSKEEARVLAEEMGRIGALSPIQSMGVGLLGPTLLEFGTEEQKARFLPPIARGEVRWCQGYSEPGAGSDLASLQTRAVDAGDHFVVSGQKMWTSGAHYADWCFCLVRTDTTKKHEGISFLLIDMKSPGVEARPIQMIYGGSTFCETFFTEVKAPKENLVGPLNGGWTVGKRLLQFERGGVGARGASARPKPLAEIAKGYVEVDEQGRIADGDLRTRITVNEMEIRVVGMTARRLAAESKANGPTNTASIMKNAVMKAGQDRAELILEIMGSRGLGWAGEPFSQDEISAVRTWLSGKSNSIWGGTHEIQNNIIAKRILGLPETTQAR